VLKATDVAYVTDRRQKVFNRGALRFCGVPLICAWGAWDSKNWTDL